MNGPNMLNRVNLQPRLVYLISRLGAHQVEEAMGLLLDYVDAAVHKAGAEAARVAAYVAGASNGNSPPAGFALMPLDPPQELLDKATQAYEAARRTLARAGADRAAYRALLAGAKDLEP